MRSDNLYKSILNDEENTIGNSYFLSPWYAQQRSISLSGEWKFQTDPGDTGLKEPDLLIFEDDLKKRNQIHCRYIAGLGLLGKREFELAEKAFSDVLSEECSHSGAVAHLLLLKDMKKASLNVVDEQ